MSQRSAAPDEITSPANPPPLKSDEQNGLAPRRDSNLCLRLEMAVGKRRII
jgi:hypothetical protein